MLFNTIVWTSVKSFGHKPNNCNEMIGSKVDTKERAEKCIFFKYWKRLGFECELSSTVDHIIIIPRIGSIQDNWRMKITDYRVTRDERARSSALLSALYSNGMKEQMLSFITNRKNLKQSLIILWNGISYELHQNPSFGCGIVKITAQSCPTISSLVLMHKTIGNSMRIARNRYCMTSKMVCHPWDVSSKGIHPFLLHRIIPKIRENTATNE